MSHVFHVLCSVQPPQNDKFADWLQNFANSLVQIVKNGLADKGLSMSFALFFDHCPQKATIHQVTTMLATFKNVLFPGHHHGFALLTKITLKDVHDTCRH